MLNGEIEYLEATLNLLIRHWLGKKDAARIHPYLVSFVCLQHLIKWSIRAAPLSQQVVLGILPGEAVRPP